MAYLKHTRGIGDGRIKDFFKSALTKEIFIYAWGIEDIWVIINTKNLKHHKQGKQFMVSMATADNTTMYALLLTTDCIFVSGIGFLCTLIRLKGWNMMFSRIKMSLLWIVLFPAIMTIARILPDFFMEKEIILINYAPIFAGWMVTCIIAICVMYGIKKKRVNQY